MPRSVWKGPPPFRMPTLEEWKAGEAFIKQRAAMILPDYVGFTAKIHDGRKFVMCKITENMIGHKFGEFAPTRKCGVHKKSKK